MTTGKVLVVHPRPTHEELAQMVGSSREVVTRAMKLLEKTGEIEIDAERILVRS
jgi:DNA-binding GntR family transcriptional regulator